MVASAGVAAVGGRRSLFLSTSASLLIASLTLGSSAQAQNVDVSGSNGQWTTAGCNSIAAVPGTCIPTLLAGGNAASWTFASGATSGVAIGTNASNGNSGSTVTGAVNITGGGTVVSSYTYLGFENNASGSVTISGAGSRWTANNATVVGHYGSGSLQILDGGLYNSPTSAEFWIGYGATGVGVVTVSGVDSAGDQSSLIAKNNIYVGNNGSGTLNILDGGSVSSQFTMYVGQNPTITGTGAGTVEVSGVDAASQKRSTLTIVNNQFWVGNNGQGTLDVMDGGLVNVNQTIGIGADQGSHSVGVVDGINQASGFRSTITADSVIVGYDGNANGNLSITNGGLISAASFVDVGVTANAVGVLTVDGIDAGTGTASTVTTGGVYIGDSGTGTLNIQNGGAVNGDTGSVGSSSGGNGTVTVTGRDSNGVASTWLNTGDLHVGDSSVGTLTIADGGLVSNATGYVGYAIDGNGTATVAGHDANGNASTWTNTGDLVIARDGTGSLSIEDGGKVSNSTGYIGADAGSSGTVTVSGRDANGNASTWLNTGDLRVGDDGVGTLTIADGGLVSNGFGNIGIQTDSQGTITVSGTDSSGRASTWSSIDPIFVGGDGTGSLIIQGGGQVTSDQGLIGDDSTGNGTVAVSGVDSNGHPSAWAATNNIYVGFSGAGALTVADGGAVSTIGGGGGAATIYLAYNPGSSGTVTVSSATANTSTLTATDVIDVGVGGVGVLTVDKGGLASAGSDVYIADQATAQGTVNLLGDATGRGVLETGSVIKADGAAILNLDGGILRANRDEPDFLNGFDALTVGGGGAWFDTNTFDIAVGTAFTGTSSFNKLGLGTLTLTGDSSAFTGTTTISAGTLQLGDGGTTGVVGGDITNNSALAFNRMDTGLVLGGVISGSGAVNQTGSGMTTLTGANTYTGFTTISAGTLALTGSGSLASSANVEVDGALDISGTTAGASVASFNGSGTINLGSQTLSVTNGANTGAPNDGIFTGAILGSGTLAVTKGSITLEGVQTDGVNYLVSKPASGQANLVFQGDSTPNNATITATNGGFLTFADTSSAGNTTITADNAAGIVLGGSADAGTSHITLSSSGWLFFEHQGNAANATVVNNATGYVDLTLTNPSVTAGGSGAVSIGSLSGAGDVWLGGSTLTLGGLGQADTISGVIHNGYSLDPSLAVGPGALVKTGAGTLTLTGANSYTGGTTVSAGTLQLGAGGASGAIMGAVVDNAALAFDRSDTVTFDGAISGGGVINQIGAGATILTANNSYAGTTTVAAGSLFVNGDQSASTGLTNVLDGGALGGVGTIGGSVVVANNGRP
jgi:fibronectin-binding autotransporter adhesin